MSTPSHFEKKRADANEKYMGFAAQPAGGGVIDILTGLDLKSDVQASQTDQVFQKRPLYVNNCANCSKNVDMSKNMTGFANADGLDVGGLLTSGLGAFSSYEQSQTAQDQAAAAAIEQAKAQQAAAAAQTAAAQDTGIAKIISSYTVPILVVGVIGIGGMIAYFYFRKKK